MARLTERVAAPRHLLVRLPNPLGDAVLATPALRALRAALPAARITWAGGPSVLAALDGLRDRDGVVPVAGRFARGWGAPLRAGRMWRRIGPDAVLLLAHSFSSALAARISGASVRVGSTLGGRGPLLTHRVDLPREGRRLRPRPMTDMYLDLAAPFGARGDGAGPAVRATPFDRRQAAERLRGVPDGARPLAVNAGAAWAPTKIYPPLRLAEAVGALREEEGVLPLVLAGPGEEALAREVAEALGPPLVSTHEDPPGIGELKALLERCSLLLTTDAGPRHLAEALGVPTVVLMGPTDPRWTAASPARLVRREDLPCLGCHLRRCPIGRPCLEDLPPRRVADAARATLRASGARGPVGAG